MVLAARHDAVVPLVSSERLAQGFGARLQTYDAGHASALVFSPSVWRDAARFLDLAPKAVPLRDEPAKTVKSGA